ncbi:MAG: PaaX family transcriptional regulator C-terminal domain-containing protein [Micromonosporaceae bacterium]
MSGGMGSSDGTATRDATAPPEPLLRPVSARSALLSMLLGAHPPTLPGRELIAAVGLVGVAEPTARVALSRMVAAGDVTRDDGRYTLSDRLLARQRRQDAAVVAATRPWHGDWELVVVTATGRSAADRAALRTELTGLRMAELREGVWMRPDNLTRPWPDGRTEVARHLTVRPVEHPVGLARELWELNRWATHGRSLLELLDSTDDPATRFAAIAMSVRHLLTDPVLPAELLPPDWPGTRLRTAYAEYRRWLIAMRPPLAGGPLAAPSE